MFLILIISNKSYSNGEHFKFLLYSEFTTLTESEKKLYIKEVQTVVVELTKEAKFSFLHYLFLPPLFAQDQRSEFNTPSMATAIELDRLDSLMRATRMYKKASIENNAPTAKKIMNENSILFVERMNRLKKNIKSTDDIRIYNQLRTEFAKDFSEQSLNIDPIQATLAVSTPQSNPLYLNKENKATVTKKIELNKIESAYCIYAGFVVYGKTCQPYKKLPSDFQLSELQGSLFQCNLDSEIICNPLLFGYKTTCTKIETKEICQKHPLCIDRSVNATKNCLQKSDTRDQHNQILEIWSNPKNKMVYEKFMNDLNQLCRPENKTSADVRRTCKVAAQRFNKIIQSQFSGLLDVKSQKQKTEKTTR